MTKRTSKKASSNLSAPSPDNSGRENIDPWMKFIICACFGIFGVHKFMEKKFGMGILYCFTFGLFGIGWMIDSVRCLIAAVKSTHVEGVDLTQFAEEVKNNVVKLLPAEIPVLRNLPVKKVLLWVFTGFLGLFALVFLPRLSGVIFLMAAALVMPIEKWQNLISRFVKGKVKAIAVAVIALLYGDGDYGKTVCMAVEAGFDTDCNGATVGSILGMANGISSIPEYWTKPIQDTLHTSIFGVDTVKISDRVKMTLKHID